RHLLSWRQGWTLTGSRASKPRHLAHSAREAYCHAQRLRQWGRVMDAFVKRCEHCNEPLPETKRGRTRRFCEGDRCRQAHRKIALRPGNDLEIPARPSEAKSGSARL